MGQIEQAIATLAKDQGLVRQAEATLAKDQAQAQYAKAQSNRYSELYNQGAVSQDQAQQYSTNSQANAATLRSDREAIANAQEVVKGDQVAIKNAQENDYKLDVNLGERVENYKQFKSDIQRLKYLGKFASQGEQKHDEISSDNGALANSLPENPDSTDSSLDKSEPASSSSSNSGITSSRKSKKSSNGKAPMPVLPESCPEK